MTCPELLDSVYSSLSDRVAAAEVLQGLLQKYAAAFAAGENFDQLQKRQQEINLWYNMKEAAAEYNLTADALYRRKCHATPVLF